MAQTLRQTLTNTAISSAINILSDHLAMPLLNEAHRDIRKAFATLQTLQDGLAAGDVIIRIPVKPYQSKHHLDPVNKCTVGLKKGECRNPALFGTYHCFRHRTALADQVAGVNGAPVSLQQEDNDSTAEEEAILPGDSHGILGSITSDIDRNVLLDHPTIPTPKREFFRATESQSSDSNSAPSESSEVPNPGSVDTESKPYDPPLWRPKKTMQI